MTSEQDLNITSDLHPTDSEKVEKLDVIFFGYLKDSQGREIESDKHWYRIMLSDGSELGWTALNTNAPTCGPVPSGQGALFRYIPRSLSSRPSDWGEMELGHLKAFSVGSSGEMITGFLSLNSDNPPTLHFASSVSESYGLTGQNESGGKILLVAYNARRQTVGLRVDRSSRPIATGDVTVKGVPFDYLMPLECQFVPCGPLNAKWAF